MVRNRSRGSSQVWRFRRPRRQRRLEEEAVVEVAEAVVVAERAERALQRVVRPRPALLQEAARAAVLRAELPLLPVQVLTPAPQAVRAPHPEAKAAEVVEPPVAEEVDGAVQRHPQCRRPQCNSWICAQRAG